MRRFTAYFIYIRGFEISVFNLRPLHSISFHARFLLCTEIYFHEIYQNEPIWCSLIWLSRKESGFRKWPTSKMAGPPSLVINEQPLYIVIVRGPVKINLLLVLFRKWSKAFIASLLAVRGNSIASKQVIIATQKCFLCLGTPVILRKHSFAGSVSVLAFLKSLIMTNKAFLLRLYQRSSGSFKHFCSLVSAHGIRFVCICY